MKTPNLWAYRHLMTPEEYKRLCKIKKEKNVVSIDRKVKALSSLIKDIIIH